MGNRPHYLRIGLSLTFGILCVLLIALWARSYSLQDEESIRLSSGCGVYIESLEGRAALHFYRADELQNWRSYSNRTPVADYMRIGPRPSFELATAEMINGTITRFAAPHWFLLITTAAIAAVPWIRWRFRLRTLLIVTTLVAVALGLVAYLNRMPTTPPLDVGDFDNRSN